MIRSQMGHLSVKGSFEVPSKFLEAFLTFVTRAFLRGRHETGVAGVDAEAFHKPIVGKVDCMIFLRRGSRARNVYMFV